MPLSNQFKKVFKKKEISDPTILKYRDQDYNKIKEACLANGELWTDPEFGPDDIALWEGAPKIEGIVWKRPKEINPDARMFVDGVSAKDVDQGRLGNCWFVASVACIAQDPLLLGKVIPDGQEYSDQDTGIWLFKFWRFGEWIEVVVDDWLPTLDNTLIYMHSKDNNEFWSALLEKAYAKIAGSYEALSGGNTGDALIDFTGGISELINLEEGNVKSDPAKKDKFFGAMNKAFRRHAMISASIECMENQEMEAKLDSGLIVGHAYGVSRVYELQVPQHGLCRLIKLRNPWGQKEWQGDWRDDDPKWAQLSEAQRKELDLTIEDDGEFWMSYDDYLSIFTHTTICRVVNLNASDEQWVLEERKGSWTKGITDGGCVNFKDTFLAKNHHYQFEILEADDETVQIMMCQKDVRIYDSTNLTIGFSVFKVADNNKYRMTRFTKHIASTKYLNTRQVFKRLELEVGTYVIIPTSFKPETEGEFLLRLFSEDKANLKILEKEPSSNAAGVADIEVKDVDDLEVPEGCTGVYVALVCENRMAKTPMKPSGNKIEFNCKAAFHIKAPEKASCVAQVYAKMGEGVKDVLLGRSLNLPIKEGGKMYTSQLGSGDKSKSGTGEQVPGKVKVVIRYKTNKQ